MYDLVCMSSVHTGTCCVSWFNFLIGIRPDLYYCSKNLAFLSLFSPSKSLNFEAEYLVDTLENGPEKFRCQILRFTDRQSTVFLIYDRD